MKPLLDRSAGGERFDIDLPIGPRRTAEEIARRAIILCCVTASLEFPSGHFNEWLEREGLWSEVSPKEVELLTSRSPSDRQRINASWRSEALQVLLWSVGKLDKLPPIAESYRSGMLDCLPAPGDDTKSFIESAQLRPEREIDDALEYVTEAHWQLRNESMYPEKKAEPIIPGVVVERHWALAWIVNVDGEPWDQTPLNT